MSDQFIDPLKGEANNRSLLVRRLREDGCFNTAKALLGCRVEWVTAGDPPDTALVFRVEDVKALHGNNAKDLWDAVMKTTPPSVCVASMTICSKDAASPVEPVT